MTRLIKNRSYFEDSLGVSDDVKKEINLGLEILKKVEEPIVTIFGSHRANKDDTYFSQAEQLAYELGKKGFGTITGGGPGIMYAANLGAKKAGAHSVGFRAGLIKRESTVDDSIFTESCNFNFLFARRFSLAIKSEALIFYPGGYGTLNELFEYLTLMQTGIVDIVPVICVGKDYWKGMISWLKDETLNEGYFVKGEKDLELISLVDEIDEIIKIVVGDESVPEVSQTSQTVQA